MEENKALVEKQNFTISTGIAGGKDAEKEVWINPFTESFKRATFTGTTNSAITLGDEGDRMRKSSLPFGMNSPPEKKNVPLFATTTTKFRNPSFISPTYENLKQYIQIKGTCERSRVPFSLDERKISLSSRFNNTANSLYRQNYAWKTPTYYVHHAA